MAGRSINVISLAGLAFAVGMVVEGAIVVCGNIIRLKESGMPIAQAAHDGTAQVVPALFASTTTTIAVFLPVSVPERRRRPDLRGPGADDLDCSRVLDPRRRHGRAGRRRPLARRVIRRIPATARAGRGSPIGSSNGPARASNSSLWVGALLVAPLLLSWVLLPKLDYLPPVKRAAIDAYFSFPPGMSPETVDREIAGKLIERMQPYMRGEKQPHLKNYYILLWPGGGTIGARVIDDKPHRRTRTHRAR